MTSRRPITAVIAVTAVIALGACGDQGAGASAQPQVSSGDAVFRQSGCASCHTLAAAGAQGQGGPNLDEARPPARLVESTVREGGGGMPAFGGRLSDAQIKAVADYVARSAGRGSR